MCRDAPGGLGEFYCVPCQYCQAVPHEGADDEAEEPESEALPKRTCRCGFDQEECEACGRGWAQALTLTPGGMEMKEIERLRVHYLDDAKAYAAKKEFSPAAETSVKGLEAVMRAEEESKCLIGWWAENRWAHLRWEKHEDRDYKLALDEHKKRRERREAALQRPDGMSDEDFYKSVRVTLEDKPRFETDIAARVAGATTVRIREIPDAEDLRIRGINLVEDFLPHTILRFIDLIHDSTGENEAPVDFFYEPWDMKRKKPLGYCFVNLSSTEDAFEFTSAVSRLKAEFAEAADSGPDEPEEMMLLRIFVLTVHVCPSGPDQQGYEHNSKPYSTSPVMHPDNPDEWKPMLFDVGVDDESGRTVRTPRPYPVADRIVNGKVLPPKKPRPCRGG